MKRFVPFIVGMIVGLQCLASVPERVRFGCESSDTTRIVDMIKLCESTGKSPGTRIVAAGRALLGTAYGGGTLESGDGVERLTVNLDTLDCTTYVETVMALAITAGEHRRSWRDFLYNLEKLRYRLGVMSDYVSRLHYISDWALDNIARGNFREVTADVPGAVYMTKSLDFMSAHVDSYPRLADASTLAGIKRVEDGFRNWRFPYVKKEQLSKKATLAALRGGDVIALTTSVPGLDVSHMAIIVMQDGVPHMMHASSAKGKVIIDPQPLSEYLRRSRSLTGIRVFRLVE